MDTLSLIIIVAFLGLYLWSVAWAIGDAQRRGYGGCLVLFLFWILGPFAALFWFAIRPKETLNKRSPKSFDNPNDSLAAAARLDKLGDWDAAVELYEVTANRWPEHADYISNCVREIKQKMVL